MDHKPRYELPGGQRKERSKTKFILSLRLNHSLLRISAASSGA